MEKKLAEWMAVSGESEQLEFKAAKETFSAERVLKYCVALSNEGGGHLVLGVTDKPPRQIVGTKAFPDIKSINKIKTSIFDKLHYRVKVNVVIHKNSRVLIFEIPPRPIGKPIHYQGAYLMRNGEALVPMTEDVLKKILNENAQDWFSQAALSDVSAEQVISMLDTQTYFDLLKLRYPSSRKGVLDRLISEGLIVKTVLGYSITNLAVLLIAKRLDAFSPDLARKAPRFIIYAGKDKLETRTDIVGTRAYAVGFELLVDYVHSSAPQNRFVEEVVRDELKMFPKQALRELIANALIHQDFQETGSSVMVEMYSDRVEISNPGTPSISVDRFIDENRSRNERLAKLMRKLHICEEKGSGIDKVFSAVEKFLLPAPDFCVGETYTTAILYAHKDFSDMSKADRIRACYQHCCLKHLSNQSMSNQTLRKRFGLSESKTATISVLISATKDANLIKSDDVESPSTRYAKYIPYWA